MQLYYSHSYRDVSINSYFFDQFKLVNEEDNRMNLHERLDLYADQKSDTWCVAKLERYFFQLSGFVSVVPRRLGDDKGITYSEYIAYELTLARRARTPRLLFVDDEVLRDYRDAFPDDAIAFLYDAPQTDAFAHTDAIRRFKRELEGGAGRPSRRYRPRQATVVAPEQDFFLHAARQVADLLRSEAYNATVRTGRTSAAAFEDIHLIEMLLDSELCVFLLSEEISYAHLVLAMTRAQCIPSIRLQYGSRMEGQTSDLSVLRWDSDADLLKQCQAQLSSFRRSFVSPFERSSDSEEAARSIAVTQRQSTGMVTWNPQDGPSLMAHIRPDAPFVVDRVKAVTRNVGSLASGAGSAFSHEICRGLYDEMRKRHFYYELEPKSVLPSVQHIRTPNQIENDRCGTCLDLACLFASLLEAAHQRAVIVIVESTRLDYRFAHALVGYFAPGEVNWDRPPVLGELRAAVHRGDAVFFEATGAVEAEKPVGEETEQERRDGEKTVDFTIAKESAERMLVRDDIALKHVIDVTVLRGRSGG
jgi:hypothetical protein